MSHLNAQISDQQLLAAAVADFAKLLKQSGFPRAMRMVNGQEIRTGIPLPVISWSVFQGNATDALHYIQTEGLPIEGENARANFLNEDWQELRFNA